MSRGCSEQQTRRVNKWQDPSQSAKPPSPVQIRAALQPFLVIHDSRFMIGLHQWHKIAGATLPGILLNLYPFP